MKSNQSATKVAKVFTDFDGESREFTHTSQEVLCQEIWDYLIDNPDCMNDDVLVTLSSGLTYRWNHTLAHYCFDKGRMTENVFVQSIFEKGGAFLYKGGAK
ncbi:MAG: hypothetical protein LBN95_07990 [Prevotellaceae bacterium]|nr:hypothetical protein [Prevotellaceae bacterium]